MLMVVLSSDGSSPGRQGFKMAVGPDGSLMGSIGGGIMEHKMVELCRSILQENTPSNPFIKHQIHRKEGDHQSGMICSGEQTIAFYYLTIKDLTWLMQLQDTLTKNDSGQLVLDHQGVMFNVSSQQDASFVFQIASENSWRYSEQIGFKNTLYVLGGGHVGLALSRLMSDLGFYIVVIDERTGLNTMLENPYAHQTLVTDYTKIADSVSEGDHVYVVIVSFGYRTDKVILEALLKKNFRYIGMMGSRKKVDVLMKELLSEGASQEQLEKVHTPIGVPINSKTPAEIAISIAAEIIGVKNGKDSRE